MKRYGLHIDNAGRASMWERNGGDWMKYEDHVADVCAMRDKLLEIANECSECEGTGCISVRPQDEAVWGRTLPCPDCEDIRELLA